MAPTKKVHKCKHHNKEVCEKACKREHDRTLQENEIYRKLRTLLGLDPKTSKAKTLAAAIQYIKMLEHVLNNGNVADGNGSECSVPEAGSSSSYNSSPIELNGSVDKCSEPSSAVQEGQSSPFTNSQQFSNENPHYVESDRMDDECIVPEAGSSSSYNSSPIELNGSVDKCSEPSPAVQEDQSSPFTNNQQLSNENLLNVESDLMDDVSADNYGLEDLIRTVLATVPFGMSYLESLQQSSSSSSVVNDALWGVAQESEPMDEPFPTEPERFSEDDSQEWLENYSQENDLIFDDRNRVLYFDTESMDEDNNRDHDTFH